MLLKQLTISKIIGKLQWLHSSIENLQSEQFNSFQKIAVIIIIIIIITITTIIIIIIIIYAWKLF